MNKQFIPLALCALLVSGCAETMRKINDVGHPPEITPIENPANPSNNYRPVSLPMPAQQTEDRMANSLWAQGSRSFFKDLRASQVGDLVTVVIDIEDDAQLQNTTARSRANNEDNGVETLFGLEDRLFGWLPRDADPQDLVDFTTTSNNNGSGSINRNENISLKVAASVVQKLPNNNLVIVGRQEVRVNYEVRELQIAGVVRPQDITPENTVDIEKIAEARVSYGGRGHISDVQAPRYGQQVLDIILPF